MSIYIYTYIYILYVHTCMYVGICAATNVLIVYTHTHIQMYICIWFSMSKIDPRSGSRETAKLHPACRNPQFRSPLSLNAQGHQSSGICGYPHKKSRVQFSNKLSTLNAKHQTSPPNFGNWRNIGCRLSGSQGGLEKRDAHHHLLLHHHQSAASST